MAAVGVAMAAFAAQAPSGRLAAPGNAAWIPSGASPEEIVRVAARVAPSAAQLAWQRRETIAFAHFGMNTFTDREWGKGDESPALFDPSALDAGQWARACKEAGLELIIVTAKHHDGFCLWPTDTTSHSVKSSPWRGGRGDVVAEVAEACRREGLGFGVYVSPWDRHEPSYGDSPRYDELFRRQLRELLTRYGEVAEVWFDGACGEGPNGKRQVYDWPSYYRVVRELQPRAVIFGMGPDVRWVGTESGYGRETEWSVVPVELSASATGLDAAPWPVDTAFVPRDLTGEDLGSRARLASARTLLWYPAEADVSIRPGWFYHAAQDGRVKTPQKLVDIYYSSVGRNALLLLNIPPDRTGRFHENDVRSLREMRRILDETFRSNLAAGARVVASSERSGFEACRGLEVGDGAYWMAADGAESAWLEIDLGEPRVFDRALLQEHIEVGQRVEAFTLEVSDGATWKPLAGGTTIGYKRLLRFPASSGTKVRIVIPRSRGCPTLSAFGLYKASPLEERLELAEASR